MFGSPIAPKPWFKRKPRTASGSLGSFGISRKTKVSNRELLPANYPLKCDTPVFASAWLIDTHSHSSAHKHGSDPEKTHSKFHARFSISSSLQMNTCPKSGFFPIQDAYPGFRSCFLVQPSFPAYNLDAAAPQPASECFRTPVVQPLTVAITAP